MQIILFRHGIAAERNESSWPDDSKRPLTPRGVLRTRRAAQGLRKMIAGDAVILTSPLERALATAKLIAEALAAPKTRTEATEALAPGTPYRKLLETLARYGDSKTLILVGHEPDLGKLAGLWLLNGPIALPLKKGGAISLEFKEGVRAGAGRLIWMLPPRVLRRLGGKVARV